MGARDGVNAADAVAKARARRVSTVTLPPRAQNMRQLAVHACVFLQTRPVHMRVGENISPSSTIPPPAHALRPMHFVRG